MGINTNFDWSDPDPFVFLCKNCKKSLQCSTWPSSSSEDGTDDTVLNHFPSLLLVDFLLSYGNSTYQLIRLSEGPDGMVLTNPSFIVHFLYTGGYILQVKHMLYLR